MKPYLRADLAKYGPEAGDTSPLSLAEARTYCCQLTRGHYENFSVSHFLLPRELRQHFCNLYAYCRWADDLADEIAGDVESLRLLDWWESQVIQLYAASDFSLTRSVSEGAAASPSLTLRVSSSSHPVFVALADTAGDFSLPRELLLDLLSAFRQDRTKIRYATFEELLDYCRRSANPVGRLVLHLGRCHTEETAQLSDSICTGLQLANFWQDVKRDSELGRSYLPREDLERFGLDEQCLSRQPTDERFQSLVKFEVERAEEFLLAGGPLVKLVSSQLRVSVRLFIDGGLAILAAIRRQGYDVWFRRPVVSKWTKLSLVVRAYLGRTS